MNNWLLVIGGLIIVAVLAKFFRKTFLAIVLVLVLEVVVIIIWPQLLVLLADLALKVRSLIP